MLGSPFTRIFAVFRVHAPSCRDSIPYGIRRRIDCYLSKERVPPKLRPQWVLIAGFGGLLAFILAAAIGTLVLLGRVRGEDRRLRQASIERLGALDQIRSRIYLSGTYIRDFLLSPDPAGAQAERVRLAAIRKENRQLLDRYGRSVAGDERDAFQALRTEIDEYWRVLETTFDWTAQQRQRLRYEFFYEQLVPRRTTMLRIADEIASINQRALARAEDGFTASAENLRWSLLSTFGIALGGGLLLAIATIILTLRLERENARARADLRELSARLVRAQEEERRSLARELHDEIGQSLSAVMMEAGNAEFAGSAEEVREKVRAISSIAGRTLNAVRDLALLLRPSMLDDFGLLPALEWQARETGKRTGLDVRLTADGNFDRLPDEHKTCIYRLVQEALNNAARHASARSIGVLVTSSADHVAFSVRDDGAGFDTDAVRGLGMLGMEERVRRLGGTLRIESHPGRGTAVSAELPVSAAIDKEMHAAATSHPAG